MVMFHYYHPYPYNHRNITSIEQFQILNEMSNILFLAFVFFLYLNFFKVEKDEMEFWSELVLVGIANIYSTFCSLGMISIYNIDNYNFLFYNHD